MGWQNDIAVKWHNDTRSLAAQLCREPLDSQSAWQALDAFSAGHYVSFGGSRDSRTKKATDLLAALGQVPSQVLRGITAQQDPTTPRSVAAQKVLRALHEVVDASDALVQMHAAADSMRVALVKGSDDLVRDALQAWQLCLATAKCQTSTPALRRVQVTFLESALAYCLQHGILLAEMACEVRELLADGRPLTTLSRVTAQQLPTLALMTASDHTLEDGFALSRAVWEAVSRLMWDRPDWFADPAVHDACCKVRTRVCNAWVAAGGKLTDPGAPAVLTAEDIQPVKRPAKHGSSVHAVPEMPRHLEPEPHLPAPCADNPTASRSDVSQAAPLAPTEAATHVQLESHRLPPPAAGLADHMGVPEEIEGLVRLSRIRRDAAHLQEYSMLLCGPPGCGKTSLARRLAATLDLPIYAFSGAELMQEHSFCQAEANGVHCEGTRMEAPIDSVRKGQDTLGMEVLSKYAVNKRQDLNRFFVRCLHGAAP